MLSEDIYKWLRSVLPTLHYSTFVKKCNCLRQFFKRRIAAALKSCYSHSMVPVGGCHTSVRRTAGGK